MSIVYFDQLSGAACNQKLVKKIWGASMVEQSIALVRLQWTEKKKAAPGLSQRIAFIFGMAASCQSSPEDFKKTIAVFSIKW